MVNWLLEEYDDDEEEIPQTDFRTKEQVYFDEIARVEKLTADQWFNQIDDDGLPF